MSTYQEAAAKCNALFESFCAKVGIKPVSFSIAFDPSYATFATLSEAETLADMLRRAGETVRPIHHWCPAEEPDFDRDEWQVTWGNGA